MRFFTNAFLCEISLFSDFTLGIERERERDRDSKIQTIK